MIDWTYNETDPTGWGIDSLPYDRVCGCSGVGCVGCVAGVGATPLSGGRVVKAEDIKALGAKLRHLQTDAAAFPFAISNPAHVQFKLSWDGLFVEWSGWESMALAGQWQLPFLPDGVYDPTQVAKFDSFEARYNESLRRFKDLGGKTAAEPSDTKSPAQRAIEDLLSGLSKTLKVAPWVLVAGAVLVGGYALLPTLAPAVARRIRR